MHLEKHEECPTCGVGYSQEEYDTQVCVACRDARTKALETVRSGKVADLAVNIAVKLSTEEFAAYESPLIKDIVEATLCELIFGHLQSEQLGHLRFREEVVIVRSVWNDVGQLEQLVGTPSHLMQRRVFNTMEKQSRDALVALGWTPPAKKEK